MKLRHILINACLALPCICTVTAHAQSSNGCPSLKNVKSTIASMTKHFFSIATWFSPGQVWTVRTQKNILVNSSNKRYTMEMLGIKMKKTQKQQAIDFANLKVSTYLISNPIKSPNPVSHACIYYPNAVDTNAPFMIIAMPGLNPITTP